MPTYRSITTSCVSQFGILTIPEYEPPKTPTDPFQSVPPLISDDDSLVSVYLPTYPSSQFWLCYSIAPPYPPKALYYFKLYINKKMVVSWGCGEEEGYQGKTMFGLFSPGPSPFQHALVERRVLFFGPERNDIENLGLTSQNDIMEIKVFRARGRKRITPEVQDFHSLSGNPNSKSQQHSKESGLNLVNAGFLPAKHPRRYYKYALLDPLDQPFATFRYYCRSWDQLEAMGVISPLASPGSSAIGSRGPTERPLSPKSSNNTMDSYITVTASPDSTTNRSTETIMHHANNDISQAIPAARDDNTASTIETSSSADPQEQDFSSPLRARIIPPFTLLRPGTPPPSLNPSKPAQLPPTIPPTDTALNTLASKESFTSLIRTHLPSPNRSAYQLHQIVAEPRPAMPLRARSASLGVLNNVLSSAQNRRKKSGDGDGGEEMQASGSEDGGKASSENTLPKNSQTREDETPSKESRLSKEYKVNENYHRPSPKVDRASEEDMSSKESKASKEYNHPSPKSAKASEDLDIASSIATSSSVASPRADSSGMHKHITIIAERYKKKGREEKRRNSNGSSNSGSQEAEKSKKKERRQVHLWEQL